MTYPMRNRMHRSTRPAAYVSKSAKNEQMYARRPGGHGFSFTGEFPEADDLQPVVATERRRQYTASRKEGAAHAVRHNEASRAAAFTRHGVRPGAALVLFMALFVALGCVMLGSMSQAAALNKSISARQASALALNTRCQTIEVQIAEQANDVNIRLEAIQMGMVSARGAEIEYLDAPENAVITLDDNTNILSLASVWGQ